jgi:hypothetical protein
MYLQHSNTFYLQNNIAYLIKKLQLWLNFKLWDNKEKSLNNSFGNPVFHYNFSRKILWYFLYPPKTKIFSIITQITEYLCSNSLVFEIERQVFRLDLLFYIQWDVEIVSALLNLRLYFYEIWLDLIIGKESIFNSLQAVWCWGLCNSRCSIGTIDVALRIAVLKKWYIWAPK